MDFARWHRRIVNTIDKFLNQENRMNAKVIDTLPEMFVSIIDLRQIGTTQHARVEITGEWR